MTQHNDHDDDFWEVRPLQPTGQPEPQPEQPPSGAIMCHHRLCGRWYDPRVSTATYKRLFCSADCQDDTIRQLLQRLTLEQCVELRRELEARTERRKAASASR